MVLNLKGLDVCDAPSLLALDVCGELWGGHGFAVVGGDEEVGGLYGEERVGARTV